MKTKENITEIVKQKFKDALLRLPAQGILFSGGLDTSIIAALCPKLPCLNVQLENHSTDLEYANFAEKKFGLKVHFLKISIEEALDAVPEVIRILKSFDPAIPNDLAVYFGLRKAKELGINSLLTGDGADEVFAGYDYMRSIGQLNAYISYITSRMIFNSNRLGEYFRIEIKQPFMDKEIVRYALEEISTDMLIAEHRGNVFGKWILREAFQDVVGQRLAWQTKRPLETGSGMTNLRKVISDRISDAEYEEKKKLYGIDFYCKDHLYYYEIYKQVIGEIPSVDKGQEACPSCEAGFRPGSLHCYTCGWVRTVDRQKGVGQ